MGSNKELNGIPDSKVQLAHWKKTPQKLSTSLKERPPWQDSFPLGFKYVQASNFKQMARLPVENIDNRYD